jgi:hypothetical protein
MSAENLFPSEDIDDTAHSLSTNAISNICLEIENKFGLSEGTLGRYQKHN